MKRQVLKASIAGLLVVSPVVYAGFRVIEEGSAPKPSTPLQIATEAQENTRLHGELSVLQQQEAALRAEHERTAAELERVRVALAQAELSRSRALDKLETLSMRFALGQTAFIPTAEESASLIRTAHAADHVSVTGYTDSSGSRSANERVALARAESAKRYLVQSGITESKVSTASGTGVYAASNDTAEGRAANRRVVFAFRYPVGPEAPVESGTVQ
ncbi:MULTISPECIES: OmpA family protein [Xanthomonas]|uniref:Putative OmpA/MotB domain protein n=1 Tax=Xanthomonas citri pv. citri TaxID=611301 RepID=A0A0U5G4G4_XANCI|nr:MULTISPECIES: OmpA family protein [Xanthomonas]ARR15377.1 hypothetical protein B7L66_24810 [Xanthomonas citri pv. citri]ARR20007.1 hypothetical protein B7L65_24460 [Xanthomonas citri pv. citri]ARR24710.1 hypothetical protein B7L67_24775 [Xanthomonas citri pv. citri]KGT55138.1 hypothetical protein NY96_13410 [Xanthomonas citri pv. fuscans]QRD58323.1 OmpA family protein [Xanthomonas citri pv. citri]